MNFQNIPRKDKVVKQAFVPKLDALLLCDYQQIELRLLAYYMATCGDSSMADAIKDGKDLHTETTKGALGLTYEPTDEERQIGKTLNFAIVYGAGAGKLKDMLGVPYPEAKSMLARFHRTWPGIAEVQRLISWRLEQRGYITTLWGRHLHPHSEHVGLNALIQGCAADLMKSGAVKVHRWTREQQLQSHLLNLVHDELILDALRSELALLVSEVPKLMDHEPVSEVVPIGVDVEVSYTSWAEKEPFDGVQGEGLGGAHRLPERNAA